MPVPTIRLPVSVFQGSTIFIDSYAGVLAKVLSIYDDLFNPFRAAALSTWRRSPLLFSAFKFFVGIYQLGFNPNLELRLEVDESRLGVLSRLSSSLPGLSNPSPSKEDEVLLVINMYGLSSSWYELGDLGLEHYTAAATLLRNGHSKRLRNLRFYEDFLIYWWMMLSFTSGSDAYNIPEPPALGPRTLIEPRMPHPLTGVSPESQLLLEMVGRLVLTHRRRLLEQRVASTDDLSVPWSNIDEARHLEYQLLSLKIPAVEMILDPGDPHTSVQDLLTIAEAYRLCGLILLYHVYPDLLYNDSLASTLDETVKHAVQIPLQRQSYRTSLALEVLQLLNQISPSSGTRTIEAILLVIVAGELMATGTTEVEMHNTKDANTTYPFPTTDGDSNEDSFALLAVLQARVAVLDRFERIQAILPFKTVRRMRSLVIETWRLMDSGSPVFWADLLIKNKWQFLMI